MTDPVPPSQPGPPPKRQDPGRRRRQLAVLLAILGTILLFQAWPWWLPAQGHGDYVVLLHGLGRSPASMRGMEAFLRRHGYEVVNIGYPSRQAALADLARNAVGPAILRRCPEADKPIHFVTHSMGGIVLRQLLADGAVPPARLGRIVMLAPPNQGSEVVDFLEKRLPTARLMGPAFAELGITAKRPETDPAALAAIGVISGDRSVNWINSSLIPGPDDGKVGVERSKLPGTADFLLVHRAHPWIMDAPEVREATGEFLRHGQFHSEPTRPL